jgi:hypothetical protein
MKRFIMLVGLAIAGYALVSLPASAGLRAGTTTCTGTFSNLTVMGNLNVPSGATCTLYYPTVAGNVTVEGHLDARGLPGDSVFSFGGNVIVDGGELWLWHGGSIAKNLTITNSDGFQDLGRGTVEIGGNLTYSDNAGDGVVHSVGDASGFYWGDGQTDVEGNITIESNAGLSVIQLTATAGGNITMNNNSVVGTTISPPTIGVFNSTAGQNLNCQENTPAPTGSSNSVGKFKTGQCSGL